MLGQASVLGLLIGTMAFHEFMDRRGPFLEEWEIKVKEQWEAEQEEKALRLAQARPAAKLPPPPS